MATSSIESHEGIRVPLGRDLYLSGYGAMGLEESAVAFSREIQRNDVDGTGRIFRDVRARSLSLSFLNAPRGEFTFVESSW